MTAKEQVWFEDEHFIFGFYETGQRPEEWHINIFGHPVSIEPSTLESLRGRTLTLKQIVKRRDWFKSETREVLVAV